MAKKLTPTQKERRALMRHIRSQVKTLNTRREALLRANVRAGIARDSIDDVLMETWRKKTKTTSKNKLSTGRLSHMSLKTLRDLGGFIDEYAGVKGSDGKTRGGHYRHYNARERNLMERKAFETLNYRYFTSRKLAIEADAAARGVKPNYGNIKELTRKQYRRMISLFSSDELSVLMSEKLLASSQIVEMASRMTEGMFDRLPQAIDELYGLFGNQSTALANMKQLQQQDPAEFRDLLLAYMIPTKDKREESLKANGIYQTAKGI